MANWIVQPEHIFSEHLASYDIAQTLAQAMTATDKLYYILTSNHLTWSYGIPSQPTGLDLKNKDLIYVVDWYNEAGAALNALSFFKTENISGRDGILASLGLELWTTVEHQERPYFLKKLKNWLLLLENIVARVYTKHLEPKTGSYIGLARGGYDERSNVSLTHAYNNCIADAPGLTTNYSAWGHAAVVAVGTFPNPKVMYYTQMVYHAKIDSFQLNKSEMLENANFHVWLKNLKYKNCYDLAGTHPSPLEFEIYGSSSALAWNATGILIATVEVPVTGCNWDSYKNLADTQVSKGALEAGNTFYFHTKPATYNQIYSNDTDFGSASLAIGFASLSEITFPKVWASLVAYSSLTGFLP